jgi:hypothetical protein
VAWHLRTKLISGNAISYTKDKNDATKYIQPDQVLTFWRLDLRNFELAGRLPWLAFFLVCCGLDIFF